MDFQSSCLHGFLFHSPDKKKWWSFHFIVCGMCEECLEKNLPVVCSDLFRLNAPSRKMMELWFPTWDSGSNMIMLVVQWKEGFDITQRFEYIMLFFCFLSILNLILYLSELLILWFIFKVCNLTQIISFESILIWLFFLPYLFWTALLYYNCYFCESDDINCELLSFPLYNLIPVANHYWNFMFPII